MSRTLCILTVAMAVGGCAKGWAQDGPPEGPQVTRLMPGMAWKVESLPSEQRSEFANKLRAKQPPSDKPKDDMKSGIFLLEENLIGKDFRRQKLQIAKGRYLTRIFRGNLIFSPDSRKDEEGEDEEDFVVDYMDGEVPWGVADQKRLIEVEWADPKWWVGKGVVDGIDCHLYRAPWPPGSSAAADPPSPDDRSVFAAIGIKDRFPRRLETPYSVRRYTVLPQVIPAPPLPAAAARALKELEEAIERQTKRYQIRQ